MTNDKIDSLLKRRSELMDEINLLTREIEDAQTELFRHISSKKVLVQRYFDGDMIIVSFGRLWWVNQNGDLLGMVEESDVLELQSLTKAGVFERVNVKQ